MSNEKDKQEEWKHDYTFLISLEEKLKEQHGHSVDLEAIDDLLAMVDFQSLRSELAKQKELNAEWVEGMKSMEVAINVSNEKHISWFSTDEINDALILFESLIKKSGNDK